MAEGMIPEQSRLSEKERFALKRIKESAPLFASEYPQIVEDARGMTGAEIAIKYNISGLYGVTEAIATKIAQTALQTLLTPEQRRDVFGPRLKSTRSKTGQSIYEAGKGLWGMTEERRADVHRRENKVKAGKTPKTRFSLSDIERKAVSARANAAREDSWFGGQVIDGMSEGNFAKHLISLPEYRIAVAGPHRGQPDYRKIADAVNQRYGKNRTKEGTQGFFERERLKEKKKN